MALATTSGLLQPANNGANSAAIKAWGSAISGLISGAGLVKASDTGQVDWVSGTFTYPTGAGQQDALVGYEVWKFTDSLQTTKPVFIIVNYREYNNSGGSVTCYYVQVQVTNSTNGSGTSNGTVQQGSIYLTNTTLQSTAGFGSSQTAFASSDGSSLVLVIGAVSTTGAGAGVVYIDRTRDSSGAPTSEGCAIGWTGAQTSVPTTTNTAGASATGFFRMLSWTIVATSPSLGSATANQGVTLPAIGYDYTSSGSTVGVEAPVQIANNKVIPPILAAVTATTTNIPAGTTFTIYLSGANHTYYSLGAFASCANRYAGNLAWSLCVRYE